MSGQDCNIFLVAYLLTSGQGGTLLFKTYLLISLWLKISQSPQFFFLLLLQSISSGCESHLSSVGFGVNGGISLLSFFLQDSELVVS